MKRRCGVKLQYLTSSHVVRSFLTLFLRGCSFSTSLSSLQVVHLTGDRWFHAALLQEHVEVSPAEGGDRE